MVGDELDDDEILFACAVESVWHAPLPRPRMPEPLVSRSPVRVVVRSSRGQLAAFASADFAVDDPVVVIKGRSTTIPTRYTLQVGPDEHIDANPLPGTVGGYPEWRFLNHACEPNTMLRGRVLVARRPIEDGEELTFDYESTEWDMATPFACECGSARCRRRIRGYRHLEAEQRQTLGAMTAPHLLQLAAARVSS